MHRRISIVLAALISFQSFHISLNDVFQLDELIEHAIYHQRQYGDDLYSFITKHYGSRQNEHMDRSHPDDHEELPFQQGFSTIHCPVVILTSHDYMIIIPEAEPAHEIGFHRAYANNLFVSKAFQPPRHS